jgi:hypothetical protein
VVKFLRGNRLGFGWDYNDLDQTRVDYDKGALEQALGRVQEHHARYGFRPAQVPVHQAGRDIELQQQRREPNDPNYLRPYTSAFDLQSNTTNLLKLYLDWVPSTA